MNILPLCEHLWKWWPLYLESNLRGEKSFLHIGDLATEEGSQRKAGRRWLLWTTSAPLCTPDPPKIGLCHLSIRAPGSRLSSTNPALNSGGVWAKSIFQWSPCDDPSQSWMPILSSSSWSLTSYRSDNGVDRGRKYFEKQKGTEPRRETEGDRASPHFHNLGCSQQKATLHLLAMQCNALQCNARANYAQTIGYNETLRITQYFECIMLF